jgi:hypothetical protein
MAGGRSRAARRVPEQPFGVIGAVQGFMDIYRLAVCCADLGALHLYAER